MPDVPQRIVMAGWYDLTPMRPDEWAETDIGRWSEAMEIRGAIEEGKRAARDLDEREQAAEKRIKELTGS